MATAVVAAGGSGERLGAGVPKALVPLHGRPMISWCLAALQASERVERAAIAAPPGHEEEVEAIAAGVLEMPVAVVTGGETRSESVANAIGAISGSDELVIHDAARPLAEAALFDRCIERLAHWGCDGVVAAARAVDTIKEADAGGRVLATLERRNLWAVQTPQVFAAALLRDAHRQAVTRGVVATDDAALVEALGTAVRLVSGLPGNVKITRPEDLPLARAMLGLRRRSAR